jgi:hypothetical protein
MIQMASTKQIEANRSNALNGKGPRTAAGKARSSRNALTHGLTAQEIVIPGEDVAAYRLFERQLIDDLQPNGSCELELIERLAATYWRLRRIPRFEAALMAWREHRDFYYDNDRTPGRSPNYLPLPGEEASPEEEFLDKHTALRWSGRDPYQLKALGRLLEDALTGDGMLLKLNTYEARLLRQSQQLLGQFFALRKARTTDVLLDDAKENSALDASDQASGTLKMLSPRKAAGEPTLD